ncbi:hypothetical protein KUTeg_008544 [Tegillarca granosa]|uniref:Peroxidase n=1 Tax=Tegillarca granosa TaxID=220873 RepID=A0ABQ9F9E8_TEGGR|nr:hypothetical protein KUTeg_008544 [Tegillarca granosa]
MDTLKLVIVTLITMVVVTSAQYDRQKLLDIIREELEELSHIQNEKRVLQVDKRVIFDGNTRTSDYEKLIEDALIKAKETVDGYMLLKSQDQPDVELTSQKELDNIHRLKKISETYEMYGLLREELRIREARNTSSLNTKLTSPRVISNEVMHSDKANQVESDYTVMFMAWGQFLDHDMVLTPTSKEPRQQINQITSFIDASNVYGSSEEEVETLRDESQRGSDFPPSGDENSCRRSDKKFHCLKAEHNRIAAMLTDLNKRWDGDRTFQETRKIIGAMLQHITYTEYLPKVLGSKLADEKGFIASKADFYDKSLNPSISNEFAVAAFRFGHSQINDHLRYYDSFFEPGRREALLRNQFDDVSMLQNNEGRRVPEVARWMVTEKSREVDRFFEEEVRDWTFKEFDLVALNIQRGRDHGIPPYSKWRLYCGLSELTDWNSLKTDHDPETIEKLKEVYGNPEDIDLYVGGVSEKHISGASVGPTFACILQEQFIRLKYGDRFWYDRNDEWDPVVGFSKEQIASIRNVTLAAVICNNVNTGEIQKDVFKQADNQSNKRHNCDAYADFFNLQPWKEE